MTKEVASALAVLYKNPVRCYNCKTVKGWLLEEDELLLLPTGDCIRFPFTIHCICGRRVPWRHRKAVTQKEILDRLTDRKENHRQD
jgi:hypothetical protein